MNAKIVRLQAARLKRLSAVEIDPDGNVVIIKGDNEQGKSSVLDVIAWTLGGRKLIQKEPIKEGHDNAVSRVHIEGVDVAGSETTLIVERKYRRKGDGYVSDVEIRTKDGFVAPSPQAILDGLYGKLAFDPLAFVNQKPAEQLNTLKSLVGLDFSDLDGRHNATYQRRTAVNKQSAEMESKVRQMPHFGDAPDEPVNVEELKAEVEARRQVAIANEKKRREATGAQTVMDNMQAKVDDQKAQIKRLEKQLGDAETELQIRQDKHERQGSVVAKVKLEVEALHDPNEQEALDKLAAASETNEKIFANRQLAERAKELKELRDRSEQMTKQLEANRAEKKKMMAEAKCPVEGLGFDDGGVTFNGLPFDQASQGQAIRVSVAMGFAMSPHLKLALIRNASLLGKKSLAAVVETAEEHGGQVWLEMVGEDAEGACVVMEDGHVRGQEPDTVEANIQHEQREEEKAQEGALFT
jgi:hypothetical protein